MAQPCIGLLVHSVTTIFATPPGTHSCGLTPTSVVRCLCYLGKRRSEFLADVVCCVRDFAVQVVSLVPWQHSTGNEATIA